MAIEVRDMVLISCYISPKTSLMEFSAILKKMEANIKSLNNRIQVVLCGDFNAHSMAWGSKYESCKGNRLVRWTEINNLVLINEGDSPTCVRPQGTSIIDLTWSTPVLANKIKEWKVEEDMLSLSDHSYITFRIAIGRINKVESKVGRKVTKSLRWKMDTLDQRMYDEVLEWKCSHFNITDRLEEDGSEDKEVEWIQQSMIEAADASMRRVKRRDSDLKKQVYWWNGELAELRKTCVQDRRRWTRAKTKRKKKNRRQGGSDVNLDNLKSLEDRYRESKRKVVKAIYRAKEEAWKSLIKEIDNDQWGIPYKAVMNRLRVSGLGLTEILEKDKLEKLIFKLFPRETGELKEEEIKVRSWKEEWEIDPMEVCNVIRRKKSRNTAPGPDGITLKMWRKVPGKMIEKITDIMNNNLRKGKFPRKWKLSKLVLIPKGENDDSDIPKARPICLLDDIGKCLKKVIVDRIEDWMEYMVGKGLAFASISKNQYGFRKNKSTIDALSRVKEIVEEARKNNETTVMVSLDIENAFNSIPWIEIRRMLKRKIVPVYLIRILNSYFKDRFVEYIDRDGIKNITEVQRGVPQGSVLGPLIWVMVYDKVLKVRKEKGCEVIGYADDTIITAVATTYEEAKVLACMQVERTIYEIRKLGLKVAVEKTVAIAFQGKKGRRLPTGDFIKINREKIKLGNTIKYLGVILDSKLDFREHLRYIHGKAEKVKRALCKLMPNLRGPHENKRRLYAQVVQSVVMYGASIWYEGLAKNLSVQRPLQKVQRQLANKIVAGYRTVSFEVATLLARMPPWILVAKKYKKIYDKIKRLKMDKLWNKEEKDKIKDEEERELLKQWKNRIKKEDLPGHKVRKAVIKCFEEWIRNNQEGVNYHLTQLLTGHGSFGSYLQRIKKTDSAMCKYCKKFIDDNEHTLMVCEEWDVERHTETGFGFTI